ncbi:hypothetical protein FRB99_002849 [Tulasnella sp. 403]|nr:hypothetical protein FRB99_002849 [Tulasnella sp. 403]
MSNAHPGDSSPTTSDQPSDTKSKSTGDLRPRPGGSDESPATGAPSQAPPPPVTITSTPTPTTHRHSPTPVEARRSTITAFSAFRGLWPLVKFIFSRDGREVRKQLSICLRAIFTLSQVIIVIVFLSLSGSVWTSKTDPDISEWHACDRPLGAWSTIWGVRGCFNIMMHAWEWRRYWDQRRARARRDVESPEDRTPVQRYNRDSTLMSEVRAPPVPPTPSSPQPSYDSPTRATIPRQTTQPSISAMERGTAVAQPQPNSTQSPRNVRGTQTQSDQMFDRMDTILTILGIVHFVGNNIFLYTSVYSCRIVAPHVWWLAFGIVCLGYVIVVELLLIAFVVFVLGPFLLLVLNILMLCLGRRVDANGNPQIHAEIPKMDKRLLALIPLKIYIPSPFDDDTPDETSPNPTYPPNSPTAKGPETAGGQIGIPTASSTRARGTSIFATLLQWFRPSKTLSSPKVAQAKPSSGEPESAHEAQFERGPYPFIRLERNRATCSICLVDFVPPKRRAEKDKRPPSEHVAPSQQPDIKPLESAKGGSSKAEAGAGAGSEHQGTPGEPLRVLSCGHVFHVRRKRLRSPITFADTQRFLRRNNVWIRGWWKCREGVLSANRK